MHLEIEVGWILIAGISSYEGAAVQCEGPELASWLAWRVDKNIGVPRMKLANTTWVSHHCSILVQLFAALEPAISGVRRLGLWEKVSVGHRRRGAVASPVWCWISCGRTFRRGSGSGSAGLLHPYGASTEPKAAERHRPLDLGQLLAPYDELDAGWKQKAG